MGKCGKQPIQKMESSGNGGWNLYPDDCPLAIGNPFAQEFDFREPCHLIDFVPTFMELAGEKVKYPEGCQNWMESVSNPRFPVRN